MKDYFYESEFVKEELQNDKRLSKRGLCEYRNFAIETGVVKNADGSAILTLGKTKVIAGVKILPGAPYPDMPDEGSISVNVELSAMSDPNFNAGPPNEDSIEISRVVDRAIRESKTLDFKTLCIRPGEFVWVVFIDIYIINNDGNLFDACEIAALTALKNAKFPVLDENCAVLKNQTSDKGLEFANNPLLFTFSKIGDKIILDTDIVEESATEARFSVAVTEEKKIVACQKGLDGSFTIDEIKFCVKTALSKHKESFAKINDAIKVNIVKKEKR